MQRNNPTYNIKIDEERVVEIVRNKLQTLTKKELIDANYNADGAYIKRGEHGALTALKLFPPFMGFGLGVPTFFRVMKSTMRHVSFADVTENNLIRKLLDVLENSGGEDLLSFKWNFVNQLFFDGKSGIKQDKNAREIIRIIKKQLNYLEQEAFFNNQSASRANGNTGRVPGRTS